MDPKQNPGPDLNVQPQSVYGQGATSNPLASSNGSLQSDAGQAPITPPPAAATSWLPPSVPVGPIGQNAPNGSNAPANVSAPAIADDGDIIEKEWVMRAKQIVDRTRQDPHLQTKELHKFKAEYMKKRYNRTIQPVEE